MKNRFLRRTLVVAMAIVVLHIVCAYALDAVGLVESLLSPSGTRLLWVLPLAVLLYALRFSAYFVAPGLVVGCSILWLVDKADARRS